MANFINRISFLLRKPYYLLVYPITRLPYFDFLHKRSDHQTIVSFEFWFKQKVLNIGDNKAAYWPVHWTSKVYDAEYIKVGVDSAPGIMGGAYITGIGGITIGDYCLFAKNIVIVTANHNIYDYRDRELKPVSIGDYCWLGAGAKVMPGVTLGDHTIVAAGAVVTSSFPDGYGILAGVPARKIKDIDSEACVNHKVRNEFHGYLNKKKFDKYKADKLKI